MTAAGTVENMLAVRHDTGDLNVERVYNEAVHRGSRRGSPSAGSTRAALAEGGAPVVEE